MPDRRDRCSSYIEPEVQSAPLALFIPAEAHFIEQRVFMNPIIGQSGPIDNSNQIIRFVLYRS